MFTPHREHAHPRFLKLFAVLFSKCSPARPPRAFPALLVCPMLQPTHCLLRFVLRPSPPACIYIMVFFTLVAHHFQTKLVGLLRAELLRRHNQTPFSFTFANVLLYNAWSHTPCICPRHCARKMRSVRARIRQVDVHNPRIYAVQSLYYRLVINSMYLSMSCPIGSRACRTPFDVIQHALNAYVYRDGAAALVESSTRNTNYVPHPLGKKSSPLYSPQIYTLGPMDVVHEY